MSALQTEFLDILERELKRRHMSRSDLARAMDVKPQMVTDYLNRRRAPGLDTIEKFLAALELEPKLVVHRKKPAAALAG